VDGECIMKINLLRKMGSLTISILLLILIIFVLIPPSTAVKLNPGTPDKVSITKGTIITFNNVNLTIRSVERIPVEFLNFSIFNETSDQLVANLCFHINSTIISQSPADSFTVVNITDINNLPYNTGSSFGYDENDGTNHSFGYGYGYADQAYTDVNILYTITYETHTTGTFYAKLFVNSSTHTYESGKSSTFTVNEYGLYDADWDYLRTITIDHDFIDNDLVDFSVLVSIDTELASKCDDGDSIRFVSTDGTTEYYYEIDEWNSSSTSYVWVKIPIIDDSADTVFYMYYGNPDVSNGQNMYNTWNSNYLMVQHLNETSGLYRYDSTSNQKTMNNHLSTTHTVSGIVGGGDLFDAANGRIHTIGRLDTDYSFTHEAWVKFNSSAGSTCDMIMAIPTNDPSVFRDTNAAINVYADGSQKILSNAILNNTNWHYIVITAGSSSIKLYIDGALDNSTTYSGSSNHEYFYLGDNSTQTDSFNGIIDECRVSSVAFNSSWINASYHSVNKTEGFLTFGSEQYFEAPTVTTVASSEVEETSATLEGTLESDGNLTATCGFRYGTSNAVYPVNFSCGIFSNSDTFSDEISELTNGQLYFAQAWAQNAKGFASGSEITFLTKPNVATSFTATTYNATQINLSWAKGDGTNYTRIQRSTDDYPTGSNEGTNVYNGTGANCSDTGLNAATTYYYSAWSYTNWDDLQQWSDNYASISESTKPEAPTDLTATTQGTSQINLGWTNGDGANYTRIQRNTGSYPTSISDGTNIYNGTGANCSDTGLNASTTYYYRAWSYANGSIQKWSVDYASASASTSSGGGGTSGGTGGYTTPSEPTTKEDEVEALFDITLSKEFYANDADGDGIVDTFTDPNGILNGERTVSINGNITFLISVGNDLDKLFLWDTETDTITQVIHSIGEITGTDVDNEAQIITITVSVEKVNWTYIEITDQYPDNPDLVVKTSDGRTISSDMIWREDGKIFILDDPTTEYLLIYSYTEEGFLFDVILQLTPDSVNARENVNALITLINVGESGLVNGTVNYTLYKGAEIIWSSEENVSVLSQKTYNKIISTDDLNPGSYTYKVTYSYGGGQTASAQGIFTINAVIPPSEIIPLWVIIIIVILISIIVLIVVLFKMGYLYFDKTHEKKDK
jgi:hypothetical protein